jgi:hypothetical protein
MLRVPLHIVLNVAALLVACAGTLEYFVLGQFLPPPFVVAVVLLGLALASRRWIRTVAIASLGLAVLIPIGALFGYLLGELVVAVPIFDALVFAWVFWNALHTLRTA